MNMNGQPMDAEFRIGWSPNSKGKKEVLEYAVL